MELPNNIQIHELRSSVIWVKEGIVYSVPKANSPLTSTEQEILEDIRKIKEITGRKKMCFILEADPKQKPPPKEQRDFLAKHLNDVVRAMAIITSSAASKMIINLFFGLKPPAYPTKMFTDFKEAEIWIKEVCKR